MFETMLAAKNRLRRQPAGCTTLTHPPSLVGREGAL